MFTSFCPLFFILFSQFVFLRAEFEKVVKDLEERDYFVRDFSSLNTRKNEINSTFSVFSGSNKRIEWTSAHAPPLKFDFCLKKSEKVHFILRSILCNSTFSSFLGSKNEKNVLTAKKVKKYLVSSGSYFCCLLDFEKYFLELKFFVDGQEIDLDWKVERKEVEKVSKQTNDSEVDVELSLGVNLTFPVYSEKVKSVVEDQKQSFLRRLEEKNRVLSRVIPVGFGMRRECNIEKIENDKYEDGGRNKDLVAIKAFYPYSGPAPLKVVDSSPPPPQRFDPISSPDCLTFGVCGDPCGVFQASYPSMLATMPLQGLVFRRLRDRLGGGRGGKGEKEELNGGEGSKHPNCENAKGSSEEIGFYFGAHDRKGNVKNLGSTFSKKQSTFSNDYFFHSWFEFFASDGKLENVPLKISWIRKNAEKIEEDEHSYFASLKKVQSVQSEKVKNRPFKRNFLKRISVEGNLNRLRYQREFRENSKIDFYDFTRIYKEFARDQASESLPFWVQPDSESPSDEVEALPSPSPLSPSRPSPLLWVNSHWSEVDLLSKAGGSPRVVVPQLQELKALLGLQSWEMAVHWYEWDFLGYIDEDFQICRRGDGACGFDTNYPDFFPARPGFFDAQKILDREEVFLVPYINPRIADVGSISWNSKNLRASSVFTPGKQIILENYGSPSNFSVMCPRARAWQEELEGVARGFSRIRGPAGEERKDPFRGRTREEAERGGRVDLDFFARNSGVSSVPLKGLYLDQVAAADPRLCFGGEEDAEGKHDHPRGGGNWWPLGNREILKKTKRVLETQWGESQVFQDFRSAKKISGKNDTSQDLARTEDSFSPFLMTESNAETYLGAADIFLTIVSFPKNATSHKFFEFQKSLFPVFLGVYGGLIESAGALFYPEDLKQVASEEEKLRKTTRRILRKHRVLSRNDFLVLSRGDSFCMKIGSQWALRTQLGWMALNGNKGGGGGRRRAAN